MVKGMVLSFNIRYMEFWWLLGAQGMTGVGIGQAVGQRHSEDRKPQPPVLCKKSSRQL